jgi:autotransporter-associated beta strand protein
VEDIGGANDNTSGRPYGYVVLKNNNSLWTGDVRVNSQTGYDQDQTAILRLEHANALSAANDVDMGFNSMLQVGGGARTIGALSTNGGVGPFLGDTAGGTMGASTNGTTVIIENAATTAGTLTITQSTPASTEVQWNAYFRDGTLNSEFFAPGAHPTASAALNIVKAGGGWATLTTDNNHTGTTTVSGGILQVGRSGVGDTGAFGGSGNRFTSGVGTIVAGTGVIQGNTAVANSVLINGSLRPGDEAGGSMGTLLVNGNLTLGAAAITTLQAQRASYTAFNVLSIHDSQYSTWNAGHTSDALYSHLLNDPVTTAQHDQLRVTGTFTINSGGKFVLANVGYTPTAGDVFNLVDWSGAPLSLNLGGIAYNGGLFRTGAETGTDLDLFQLGNGFLFDVSQFNTTGNLIVVQANSRQLYWNGDQDSNWNTNNAGNTNWLDAPAGSDAAGTPAFTDDVHFTADSVGSGGYTTSLGANFAINTLNFGEGANTSNSATVDTGANTLTVYNGITQASGSAANTISGSGGVVLAQNQTWTNNSVNSLTVSAPVSGSANLTKAGSGTVILSGTNTYSGTTTVSGGNLQLGDGGTTGSLNTASTISIAAGATFTVNQSDTVTQGTEFSGAAISGAGSITQAGSGTTVLNASNTYTGGTNINGGVLRVDSADAIGTTGTVTFGGGTLQHTANNTVDYSARIGNSTSAIKIDTNGQNVSYATQLAATNTGGLEKIGGGTLSLDAAAGNLYTGNTTVTGGTLLANNTSGSATGTGTVTVGSGATLGGSGIIDGDTTIQTGGLLTAATNGTIDSYNVGAADEGLVFSGNLTVASDSTWLVDLSHANNTADFVQILGDLDLGGSGGAILALNLLDPWQNGDYFRIAQYTGTLSGTFKFNSTALGQGGQFELGTGTGRFYQINYADDGFGGPGNFITLTAVPEPSTVITLIVLLLLGLWFGRRRLRQRPVAAQP